MKKVIKTLIILVIIGGLAVGGVYGGYKYNNGKKVAQVVPLSYYGMDGFWGDSVESYGQVTSDKAQTAYIASGTEVVSVNVAAGDHVNEGDVLLTVKKESQDITGKELQVQKAQQTLVAAQNKLDRLENTVPIPEYISSSVDTRTRTYIYYDEELGEDVEGTYEEPVGKFYYNAETGAIIGYESLTGGQNYPPPQGYKPSELKEAVENAEKEVARADLDYRIKSLELEVMKNTDDSGAVRAKVSGTVSKVQNKDNYNTQQPFVIVTATDEYYITGSIGEFYLDSINIGDTVSISSWDTGLTTDAVISSISDIPNTEDNYSGGGNGNTNVSNYEFKANFDRSSGIEIGSAVNITLSPAGQETGGLYIPKEFVRKDNSGNFVMKMNDNNQLEKVYVKVGRNLWDYYLEIKDGITMNDYIAFPYGNGEVEGMNCEIVDSLDY